MISWVAFCLLDVCFQILPMHHFKILQIFVLYLNLYFQEFQFILCLNQIIWLKPFLDSPKSRKKKWSYIVFFCFFFVKKKKWCQSWTQWQDFKKRKKKTLENKEKRFSASQRSAWEFWKKQHGWEKSYIPDINSES